jgi:cytoskeleton-associated protein 5
VVAEVIAGLIAKCLISPKVKTRELALEIVLMSVEIEKFDVVLEELMKGLDNKTPKVVVSCITLIKECLKNFGVKVISVKPIVKVSYS